MTMMRDSLVNHKSPFHLVKTRTEKLSVDQRTALRGASAAALEQREKKKFTLAIEKLFKTLIDEMMMIFAPPKHNAMCKNYGHVIHDVHWKGLFPICGECGQEVTDKKQLRKATPHGSDYSFIPTKASHLQA